MKILSLSFSLPLSLGKSFIPLTIYIVADPTSDLSLMKFFNVQIHFFLRKYFYVLKSGAFLLLCYISTLHANHSLTCLQMNNYLHSSIDTDAFGSLLREGCDEIKMRKKLIRFESKKCSYIIGTTTRKNITILIGK